MLFKSLPESIPFLKFQDFYLQAEDARQPFTEAGCISSVDQDGAPHARYVNFKYFFEDNLIFFSSYTSNKALDFDKNQKVAINFWWPSIDVQIRAEGVISKCPEKFSDEHFYGREQGKILLQSHLTNQSLLILMKCLKIGMNTLSLQLSLESLRKLDQKIGVATR